MNTFVVLAAGRGTRIGRVGKTLHKALVPLDGRAALSHLFKRAGNAKLVVCVGHRAEQLRQYTELAHPNLNVTFVDVPGWDQPGGGPGRSLLAARPHIIGDLTFTSCDTLWDEPFELDELDTSWAAVAPIPAGTLPTRWCRLVGDTDGRVERVFDKTGDEPDGLAYTGLAHVVARDLQAFWNGINRSGLVNNELQVSGGLAALAREFRLWTRRITWTDIGDEASYRLAVAKYSGYDWTKLGQATYVLPEEGRVVKFSADEEMITARAQRASLLGSRVPQPVVRRGSMLAYPFVGGLTGYQAVESDGNGRFIELIARWLGTFPTVDLPFSYAYDAAHNFYDGKTRDRALSIGPLELRRIACDALSRVDFKALALGCQPGVFHGDANLGNVIRTWEGSIIGIDWREDFDGSTDWGDLRYDRAKLLAGTVVNWDAARRGDFRPWAYGRECRDRLLALPGYGHDVQIIAALSLLNSAPLHAAPLDEVLVAHGASWLEELS